jgi:hypothetical protein
VGSQHAQPEVGAVEDQTEAAALASRDVDQDLVAVAALAQLDACSFDELPDVVAGARRVELDRRLVAVDRLERDLPGGHPQVERQRAGRVEGLAPHLPDLTTGRRRRARRGSREST